MQVVLKKVDVPIGTAILSLFQTLGGAVFTAVGQNLYIAKFSQGLQRINGVNSSHVLASGATDLTGSVPPELRESVLEAYNMSLAQGTFLAALFVACLAVPAALGMEWRSVKRPQEKPEQAAADVEMSLTTEQKSTAPPRPEKTATRGRFHKVNEDSIVLTDPAGKKLFRTSGQISHWVTVKVNPDLRTELDSKR